MRGKKCAIISRMPYAPESAWTAVDSYFVDTLVRPDPLFEDVLRRSEAAGLPAISVTAAQGKLLHLLASMQSPRNILEIGTLGGYSAVWLARALEPGGRLVTVEYEPIHAEVARETIRLAGLSGVVDLRVGAALDMLPAISAEHGPSFDFTFVDADKPSAPAYFDWAVGLSRPGGLIVVDNVVRNGALADASSDDPRVIGMRRLVDQVAADTRVTATGIQTVGSKGYDGFVIARVLPRSG
jgi:predicted O-methyltransferase YrrM